MYMIYNSYIHCVLFILDNTRVLYIATNYGGGYVTKLFDPDLGYFYSFILDGDIIFASKVRIVCTSI